MTSDNSTHPQPTADQPFSITRELWDRGVRHLPPDDLTAVAASIREDLDLRVGEVIFDLLTPAQVDEFDTLHSLMLRGELEEDALREWLAHAVPSYKDITRRVVDKRLTEVVAQLNGAPDDEDKRPVSATLSAATTNPAPTDTHERSVA